MVGFTFNTRVPSPLISLKCIHERLERGGRSSIACRRWQETVTKLSSALLDASLASVVTCHFSHRSIHRPQRRVVSSLVNMPESDRPFVVVDVCLQKHFVQLLRRTLVHRRSRFQLLKCSQSKVCSVTQLSVRFVRSNHSRHSSSFECLGRCS